METLVDLIIAAQAGDKLAKQEIVDRFSCLLEKYARKLKREDSFEDLQLELLVVIEAFPIHKIAENGDGAAVNYLRKSMHNAYICLSKRAQANRKHEVIWSDLTEEQQYSVDAASAIMQEPDFLPELLKGAGLTAYQEEVLTLHYGNSMPISEIAKQRGVSRQSVDKVKRQGVGKVSSKMGLDNNKGP